MDPRYHFISEKFNNDLICLEHCPTNNQLADLLTKPE